jgi:predicted nucleotide-binding protein
MPRRTPGQGSSQQRGKTALVLPRSEASARLIDHIQKGEKLQHESTLVNNFRPAYERLVESLDTWREFGKELLRHLFDTDEYSKEFNRTFEGSHSWPDITVAEELEMQDAKQRESLRYLRSLNERLTLIEELENTRVQAHEVKRRTVFVVHGRDDAAKEAVARFLERLDLKPIILHEQPSQSRTIIEKFEAYSGEVGFAVILLTADDVGALATEPNKTEKRARQNVVFEFGYFVGKLGRSNVAALSAADLARPSDIDGIVYISYDASGGWRLQLGREIKAAGIEIDLNRAV